LSKWPRMKSSWMPSGRTWCRGRNSRMMMMMNGRIEQESCIGFKKAMTRKKISKWRCFINLAVRSKARMLMGSCGQWTRSHSTPKIRELIWIKISPATRRWLNNNKWIKRGEEPQLRQLKVTTMATMSSDKQRDDHAISGSAHRSLSYDLKWPSLWTFFPTS
jgi:hypothetical protein